MAKAPKVTKNIQVLTGMALLAAVANSAEGYLMLTQAEAIDGINEGNLELVPNGTVDGDKAAVRLTDAGFAAFQASEEGDAAQAASRQSGSASSSSYEIESDVAMPTGGATRRGRQSSYPFDKLEVGQSFHVAKDDANEDPAARLASSVSGANAKYAEEVPGEFKSHTVKTYAKGEDGKWVKDEDGKRVVESETEEQRPVMKFTRRFIVKAVDKTDPKGEGARVWRVE